MVTISIIMVCSLCLASITGTVIAQKSGYAVENYHLLNDVTLDGTWTTPIEWADAEERQIDGDLNAIFRVKKIVEAVTAPPAPVTQYILIEFFDDTTNDAGDYLQICLAATFSVGTDLIGGTSPQDDCFKWDYVGHTETGLSSYSGDGAAWIASTYGSIQIKDTLGTSPLSDTPHWIVEVRILGFDGYGQGSPRWIRIAAYDESNAGAGVQAWPAGSADVPDDWGQLEMIPEFIPEFASWMILPMVAMASFAIIIVRKRLTKNGTPT